jgi:hypothetical protein
MNPTITSRELLAEVGAYMEEKPDIPLCYRPLLITSVITFVPARKLQKALNARGEVVSYKDVLEWQRATREWLGLPEVSRGKPSDECKDTVKKWLRENGNPTPEEIDAGWLPLHLRREKAVNTRNLSPRYKSMFENFRNQVDRLKSADPADTAWDLLKEILSSESE